ncbi:hypothetical protein HYDPIDRAFT_164186 [Hydnomerulius pinastri MD-312]|nr:hypothetical protein HYDPIDRAFT_164186 [Hydnomerulius pinastri MD-312]
MASQHTRLYRSVVREVAKASISPRAQRNKEIPANFRTLFDRNCRSDNSQAFEHDAQNIVTFMRSQREHKALLERYNPLIDLTAEERIEATARRVGLNMPVTPESSKGDQTPTAATMMNIVKTFLTRLKLIRRQSSQAAMSFSTQVLKCDPASISFDADDQPQITSSQTLESLQTASRHLVDTLQPVAFPTETVYGLGALALSAEASARIFSTKGRPADNPLIVHVSSERMLQSLLPPNYSLPASYRILIRRFWPGPLTLLFPSDPTKIPSIITANHPTVAIRMPSHPVARALIAISNSPLAAPSANSSGKPSPTRAEHVFRDLEGKVGLVLDGGACEVGLESTVVDGLHEDGNIRVLRPGGVTVEEIEQALQQEFSEGPAPKVLVHRRDFMDDVIEQAPTTPGMKYRHYSPSVPVTLLRTVSSPPLGMETVTPSNLLNSLKSSTPQNAQIKVGLLTPSDSVIVKRLLEDASIRWHQYDLGSLLEPAVIAQRLFDGLLTLEREGVDMILVEEVAEEREGLAIMNRVKKAAGETCWMSLESA